MLSGVRAGVPGILQLIVLADIDLVVHSEVFTMDLFCAVEYQTVG